MGWYFDFHIIKGPNWFKICINYTYFFRVIKNTDGKYSVEVNKHNHTGDSMTDYKIE